MYRELAEKQGLSAETLHFLSKTGVSCCKLHASLVRFACHSYKKFMPVQAQGPSQKDSSYLLSYTLSPPLMLLSLE